MSEPDARATAERIARASHGRLVAILAAATRDIALAEDCVADAFERALITWPQRGVPSNPEGWLLTVARNRQRDQLASAANRTSAPLEEGVTVADADDLPDHDLIPDKRLELLFVCAHPAIDAGIRTPLMLQVVLGIEAVQIAQAFAVPAATMAQRLVRAKRRIRDAGIAFSVPSRADMAERLPPVLEAIYGGFSVDWNGDSRGLAGESLYLATTLVALLGEETAACGRAEALGLAALIALSSARTAAREVDGEFVPLDAQDPSRWDGALIAEGEAYLGRAHALGCVGRFQLEAAIHSAHVAPYFGVSTDWLAVRAITEALVAVSPTLGARVSLAAVIARLDGPSAARVALDGIPDTFDAARRLRASLNVE